MTTHPLRGRTFLFVALLVLGTRATSSSAQVLGYDAFKSAQWFQTTANPEFGAGNALWFGAGHVALTSASDAASGSLATQGASSPFALTADGNTFGFQTGYLPSLAALDAEFPGSQPYAFSIADGNLGSQSGSLAMPANNFPSEIPVFANFSSFNAIDPHHAAFQWNGWTIPDDSVIFFTVRDLSDVVVHSTFFTTGQTSYTVPDGILTPGGAYSVEVIFSSRVTTGLGQWQETGVQSFAGWDNRTAANFTAVPEPASFAAIVALAAGAIAALRWPMRHRR